MKWMSLSFGLVVLGLFLLGCTSPNYSNSGNPTAASTPALETVAGTPTPSVEQASTPISVQISMFSFSPATVTVPVGTTVTWTNQDSAAHTVTSDTGAFDSGSLSQGGSWSNTFNQPGSYAYHCAFHGSMHGTVVVTA